MPQANKEQPKPRKYRRQYTPEFKRQIVELCKVEGTVKRDIADQYDIPEGLMYEWIKAYDRYGTFDRTEMRAAKLTQVERLQKQVKRLEMENSILKDLALMLENLKQKPSAE